MGWKSSIQAVHNGFKASDTSNIQSRFTNTYLAAIREFQNFKVSESSNSQSNFTKSGYIYLPYNPVYLRIDENILVKDWVVTSPTPAPEKAIVLDQVFIYPVVIPIFSVKTVISGNVLGTWSVKTELGQISIQEFSVKTGCRQYNPSGVTTLP